MLAFYFGTRDLSETIKAKNQIPEDQKTIPDMKTIVCELKFSNLLAILVALACPAVSGGPPGLANAVPVNAFTDTNGAATFQIVVPTNAPAGPIGVTVGVMDPNNALTADGVLNFGGGPVIGDIAVTSVEFIDPQSRE